MFVHNESLPYLLESAQYWDRSLYIKEDQLLRGGSWFFVCLNSEVLGEGEYRSRLVAGVPLVAWRQGGKLRVFKNVCPHRHSKIVPGGYGKSSSLVCQYHGWEYDFNGKIRHIPEAEQYRNLVIPVQCLDEYPVEVIGDCVLICFNGKLPSLRTSLGKVAQEIDVHFEGRRSFYNYVREVGVNWKLVVENFIETYHIPVVHGHLSKKPIFRSYGAEELSEHVLESTYTRYFDARSWTSEYVGYIYSFLAFVLCSIRRPKRFIVTHVFPNFIFYYSDLFSVFFYIEPLEAERTRIHTHFYSPGRLSWSPISKPIRFIMEVMIKIGFQRVLEEDYALLGDVQEGIRQAQGQGILSRREERIHSFQKYLKDLKIGRT